MIAVLEQGDCRAVLPTLDAESVDAVVTDPPYELRFMGKKWDSTGIAHDVGMWTEVLRVLKPGGHLLSFGGTRTWHRMVCAVEDAGFEVRDSIAWLYGSGFPKSLDVGKAIDKAAGAERGRSAAGSTSCPDFPEPCSGHPTANGSLGGGVMRHAFPTAPATPEAARWDGWGTALKPAHEPIVVARKPLTGTVAANVVEHGTGALNIDGCRIGTDDALVRPAVLRGASDAMGAGLGVGVQTEPAGRWPANVVLDETMASLLGDKARYFYCPKASRKERGDGTTHPTVKPLSLIDYLVTLVTPPGGVVLDPFAGSGTTLVSAVTLGFDAIGIELDDDHLDIAERRVRAAGGEVVR